MRSHTFQIIVNQAEFLFHPDTGGFPSSITAKYPDGTLKTLVKLQQSPFSILVGEQTYKPRCDASTPVLRYRRGSSVVVEYARIPWFNSKHEPLDDLYLSLKWEIHQDGAVFCDMFLFYATIHVPKIRDFKINIPLDSAD